MSEFSDAGKSVAQLIFDHFFFRLIFAEKIFIHRFGPNRMQVARDTYRKFVYFIIGRRLWWLYIGTNEFGTWKSLNDSQSMKLYLQFSMFVNENSDCRIEVRKCAWNEQEAHFHYRITISIRTSWRFRLHWNRTKRKNWPAWCSQSNTLNDHRRPANPSRFFTL